MRIERERDDPTLDKHLSVARLSNPPPQHSTTRSQTFFLLLEEEGTTQNFCFCFSEERSVFVYGVWNVPNIRNNFSYNCLMLSNLPLLSSLSSVMCPLLSSSAFCFICQLIFVFVFYSFLILYSLVRPSSFVCFFKIKFLFHSFSFLFFFEVYFISFSFYFDIYIR